MLTSQMVKDAAIAAGADLCGVGSMDRFEGVPKEMDPAIFSLRRKALWEWCSEFPAACSAE